jgi:hypothetical protein
MEKIRALAKKFIPMSQRILLRKIFMEICFVGRILKILKESFDIKIRGHQKYNLSDFRAGFKDLTITPTSQYYVDNTNFDRIISAYLKSKQDQLNQPIEYQIGGEWAGLINDVYGDLVELIKNKQYEQVREILSNFAKHKISLGLSAYGSIANGFFKSLDSLNSYNKSYRAWKDITGLPDSDLIYPKIGNLHGIRQGDGVIGWTSFRMSYFAQRIEELLSGKVKANKSVLEIGGGYGELPYFMFSKSNFSKISYMNLDIPENNLIVSFFLMSAFPKKTFLFYGENLSIENYDVAVMPNYYLKSIKDNSFDLVFNSHSLTEMSQETVKEYIKQIDRVASQYFLHANHEGNPDDYGSNYSHVNLYDSEFEISKSSWQRLYRVPEVLTNIAHKNRITLFTYWEYLYQKK